jgi:hypothetical protein
MCSQSRETFACPEILFIRQYHHWATEHAFNLGDRNPVFLALLTVAAIPIEARKFHDKARLP